MRPDYSSGRGALSRYATRVDVGALARGAGAHCSLYRALLGLTSSSLTPSLRPADWKRDPAFLLGGCPASLLGGTGRRKVAVVGTFLPRSSRLLAWGVYVGGVF